MIIGGGPSWVLTRLHTRYSKETLSEDLIFRQAKPAMGGRANWNGTNGDEGATVAGADGVNNFQGRYIIRHYWDGPVACKTPAYDQWGGAPGKPDARPTPTAAKGLATAPRGKVALKTEVRSPVPLLGIPGKPPQRQKTASAAAKRAGSGASRPRWSPPACALIARGSAPSRGPLPRFEPHGRDVGVALGIEEGPSNDEVAAEVARQGFYAGAPVGSGDCIGCHKDVAAQWASSAHRFSSFNNPYYRVATDAFRAGEGRGRVALLRQLPRAVPGRDRRDGSPASSAARAPRRLASPAWSAIRSPTSIARATAATRPTCARCRPPRAYTARGCGRR